MKSGEKIVINRMRERMGERESMTQPWSHLRIEHDKREVDLDVSMSALLKGL